MYGHANRDEFIMQPYIHTNTVHIGVRPSRSYSHKQANEVIQMHIQTRGLRRNQKGDGGGRGVKSQLP